MPIRVKWLPVRYTRHEDACVEAGKHAVSWDASAVPSGVYFYNLTCEGYTAIKMMNLMK